jgi:hypothetical protein
MVQLRTRFAISMMVAVGAVFSMAQAPASAKSPGATPNTVSFDVADVHVSPHVLRPFMDGGNLNATDT